MITKNKEEFPYVVTLPIKIFLSTKIEDHSLSEIHIWMIENLGLPGHRYQYHPSFDVVYKFKDERDAIWFKLRWQ